MNSEDATARQLVVEQVLYATTREEIHAARAALHAWVNSHPHDATPLADGFALLATLEEAIDFQQEPQTSQT